MPKVTPVRPTGSRRPTPTLIGRLLFGLGLFGFGIALMVAADLGLAPWDVMHQGISKLTPIPIGSVGIIVGLLLLTLFRPLGEKIGLGTLLNVVMIGAVIDLTLLWLDTPEALWGRWVFMLGGIVLIAIGSGFYIGVGLGSGPRDGLMTGLAKRGVNVGIVRTGIEITVLLIGLALGGTAGAGTVAFTFGIGPLVAFFLPRLSVVDVLAPDTSAPDQPAPVIS
ncbi:MAG: putative membrane protein YczE [Glaciecola sp.]|jgi:uncharacterized membrane protein YczE